jgi:K+-sensing histidine kinase KdpD
MDSASIAPPGVEVSDLLLNMDFQRREVRARNGAKQVDALRRLARVFAENPERVLQELSEVAADLCGADSAGVSLESKNEAGDAVFHWAATCGEFAPFLDAMLPRHMMPCAICLDRNKSQLVRVAKTHFDNMGVDAEPITDGLLIPWEVDGMRGTVWILAHGRTQAFDSMDYETMESLANFAAMAVRHQRQQRQLLKQATAAAAAAMANELAHSINNPLQSLTNMVYLAGKDGGEAEPLAQEMSRDLQRLTTLVKKLLALPIDARRLE